MGQIKEEDNKDIVSDLQSEYESDIQIEEDQKKHKCDYPDCNAVFLRPSRLKRHKRSHTGERPYKCSYPECTKSYTNSCHLKRHMVTHNSTKKLYKCTECSMEISYLHNLKRHYKRMHGEKKRFSCKECDESFNKKHQFVKHQEVAHSIMSTIYNCEKCTKNFQNHSKFKRHQTTHQKTYPCPVADCTEVFSKWSLLRTHKATEHITHYRCDTCDREFLNKCRLKVHSKIHSADRELLQCPYDNCQKTYYFKYNFEEHVRIRHLGQRFYCDICSAGLTSKQKLIAHIQRHDEPKKPKKKRKPQKRRKDAGVPKKSVLTAMIGVDFPAQLEKMMLIRETVIVDDTKTVAC